ncbi:MAG: hypothetical protein CMJ34_13480 [Phycisphaerae bacterium]|nr:hypothetical protein [Phycisphaerae bacterium]
MIRGAVDVRRSRARFKAEDSIRQSQNVPARRSTRTSTASDGSDFDGDVKLASSSHENTDLYR